MSKEKLTPMLRQFLEIKNQHPDKLILFRMGDFYETFFEDAKLASKYLGITLTSRNKKADNPIPLAGFPYHALDNYLDKLVKNGLKVVICEQMEDPQKAVGIVKRGIVDIITPGSIIDGNLLNNAENNYLAALYFSENFSKVGLSFIDASTADYYYTQLSLNQLKNEILRIAPSEIVVINSVSKEKIEELLKNQLPMITLFEDFFADYEESKEILKEQFQTSTLEGFSAKGKKYAVIAAAIAISYIKSLKKSDLSHITSIRYYSTENFMQVDETTRRNLELLRSIRFANKTGTLISVIDKTKTPMGSRELEKRLLYPLLDKNEINKRLDFVQIFKDNIHLTNELRTILSDIGDLSRLLSKIGTLRINPREVITLKNYLSSSKLIKNILSEFPDDIITQLSKKIGDYQEIVQFIESAVSDEPPIQITEGNIIKEGYNSELDELRKISFDGKNWIARLEEKEREKLGIPSLKIGYNKVFGYYIEVTKTYKTKIPDYYIRKQTLVNAERYISPQLKEYESKVLGAEERIKNIEYELFGEIRQRIKGYLAVMQKFEQIVAEVDVYTNLAFIAYQNDYNRPLFNDEGILEMTNSRHPVIEKLLDSEKFIPNDVFLNNTDHLIALITGPNMAGKSTYLRQVGLLVIMAQMGSFIPAESANLPIIDKVFTRVGASDNLAFGQSTFLVEMLETANILNSATNKSLILLDEIGRGTSTFDGLSLAWAIVEYIHNYSKLKSKTLFATHYHELTELESILNGVKNYNISVKEWNDKIIFLRKIERGSADQSYGIQVAQLAGIPKRVIKRAKQILQNLEENEISPQGLIAKVKKQMNNKTPQLDLLDYMVKLSDEKDEILEEIRNIDINSLTPIEALKILSELQDKI